MDREFAIGVLATIVVAILAPQEYDSWIINMVVGMALSTFFMMPLSKAIKGEKLAKVSAISFLIGVVLFYAYTQYEFGGDYVKALIFLAKWIATFAFISVIFQTIFSEVKEELAKLI